MIETAALNKNITKQITPTLLNLSVIVYDNTDKAVSMNNAAANFEKRVISGNITKTVSTVIKIRKMKRSTDARLLL